MTKLVEVLIDEDGAVTIEALGYTGTDCLAATREIEAALGRPSAPRKMKREAAGIKNTVGARR